MDNYFHENNYEDGDKDSDNIIMRMIMMTTTMPMIMMKQ